MDTVKEHGPCAEVTEDNFEKSHGALRNHFFIQNQKARGRDTILQYIEEEMLLHILEGGYHKTESGWYVHKHIKKYIIQWTFALIQAFLEKNQFDDL